MLGLDKGYLNHWFSKKEKFKRMKELYGYKSSTGTQNSGKFENGMVGKMISESKEKLIIKNEGPKERFFKTLIESQK